MYRCGVTFRWMNDNQTAVERMFPFVLRSRILLVGRETLARSKGHLHFVLLTTDLSEKSRERILQDFSYYPIVQRWTSADLEVFFGVKGAKVVGFRKSGLAQSIYAELKAFRINKPVTPISKEGGKRADQASNSPPTTGSPEANFSARAPAGRSFAHPARPAKRGSRTHAGWSRRDHNSQVRAGRAVPNAPPRSRP